jgi:hypothetical protein
VRLFPDGIVPQIVPDKQPVISQLASEFAIRDQ